MESEAEGEHSKLPLLKGVVSIPLWIKVHEGYGHQPNDDKHRKNDTGNPGIKIDKHFL